MCIVINYKKYRAKYSTVGFTKMIDSHNLVIRFTFKFVTVDIYFVLITSRSIIISINYDIIYKNINKIEIVMTFDGRQNYFPCMLFIYFLIKIIILDTSELN